MQEGGEDLPVLIVKETLISVRFHQRRQEHCDLPVRKFLSEFENKIELWVIR